MAWRWRRSIEDAADAQPSFGGTMTVRVSPTFMSSTASSKPGICAPTPSVNCCGRAGKVCLVPSTCVIRNRTDGVASERDMVRRGDERRAAACRRRPRVARNRAAPAGRVLVCRRSPRPRRGTAGPTSSSPRAPLRRAGRALVLQRSRHSRRRGRNAACCWSARERSQRSRRATGVLAWLCRVVFDTTIVFPLSSKPHRLAKARIWGAAG